MAPTGRMTPQEVLAKYTDAPAPIFQHWGEKFVDFRVQQKWDIPEPVIIGVSVTGHFIDREQNPNQPMTASEIREAFLSCIPLGAVSLHVHIRDEQGRPSANLKDFHAVLDPIRARYGKQVLVDGGCMTGKTFEESVGPVTEGMFDVAIVNPTTGLLGDTLRAVPPRTIQAQAEYFQAAGVKPLIDVHDASSIGNAKRYLFDTGIIQKPTFWHLLPGIPGTFHLPNPHGMMEGLLYIVNRIREIDPDAVMMVSDPGRATIYMTAFALMMGLHIRIGMEDTLWKFPHRDEKIGSNAEVVKKAVELAALFGRRPATADEYRSIIGLN